MENESEVLSIVTNVILTFSNFEDEAQRMKEVSPIALKD